MPEGKRCAKSGEETCASVYLRSASHWTRLEVGHCTGCGVLVFVERITVEPSERVVWHPGHLARQQRPVQRIRHRGGCSFAV